MKKLIFTIYLIVLFIFSANAADLPHRGNEVRLRHGIQEGDISRTEARRLVRGERRIHQMRRNIKSDGIVTRGEARRLRHANRIQKRHIRRQKSDSNQL